MDTSVNYRESSLSNDLGNLPLGVDSLGQHHLLHPIGISLAAFLHLILMH